LKLSIHDGKEYRLPNGLTDFQTKMYLHLINRKWDHIILEPGKYQKKDKVGVLKNTNMVQFCLNRE
jgi:hypothetical protein